MKETTETVSQEVKTSITEGVDKVDGFFGDLGKQAEGVKDDVSEKLKGAGSTIADTTKQAVDSTQKETEDRSFRCS